MPIQLVTPHISLGTPLQEALVILDQLGHPIVMDDDGSLTVETPDFKVTIYHQERRVRSVLYDDPLGGTSEEGTREKIDLYLNRYGLLVNWELRLENGWMRYWFNPADGAAMVYGIDHDVIRFNEYSQSPG